ncbi:hypothetical protein [Halomonas koreensis]|uniref:Uncharacterized protein n=1 Tax=Halomonas koreensis TaxID=245385 RepID=A0ABU1FXV2_9GAMM|nr:hypothetical protein [Halomonas koreensis]MDR5865510.1 hypothetical protein [Halomonas koreensis]
MTRLHPAASPWSTQQHGGVSCVPVAVVSGFILSLLSPPPILFLVSL